MHVENYMNTSCLCWMWISSIVSIHVRWHTLNWRFIQRNHTNHGIGDAYYRIKNTQNILIYGIRWFPLLLLFSPSLHSVPKLNQIYLLGKACTGTILNLLLLKRIRCLSVRLKFIAQPFSCDMFEEPCILCGIWKILTNIKLGSFLVKTRNNFLYRNLCKGFATQNLVCLFWLRFLLSHLNVVRSLILFRIYCIMH